MCNLKDERFTILSRGELACSPPQTPIAGVIPTLPSPVVETSPQERMEALTNQVSPEEKDQVMAQRKVQKLARMKDTLREICAATLRQLNNSVVVNLEWLDNSLDVI